MDDFPASWRTVKRYLPPLLAYGAGNLYSAWRAGRRASSAISADSSVPVTWQGERPRMAYSKKAPRRSFNMRRRYYRRRVPRAKMPLGYRRIVRSTGLNAVSIAGSGTQFSSIYDIALSGVQTSDLLATYTQYRIRKVVMHLTPRVDPANSGVSNNFQCLVGACCDSEGPAAPAFFTNVTAYDNSYSKWVNAGEQFTYTFYPKAVNSVDINGTATAAGSYGMNPWLQMTSTGITVPHKRLLYIIQSGSAVSASGLFFDFYFDIHFDVKGFS